MPHVTTPERSERLGLLAPAALVVAYVGVVVQYLRPPMTQDAMNYFERAAHFPDIPGDHWSFRIGLLLPVHALQWLFGYSEVAYYAVPIASGAVLILGTYWLGRRLFNTAVGVGAALVLMFSGPFLTHATVLLPDQLAAALFVAALALLLVAVDRPHALPASTHALLAVAGCLLGWAYLVREFIPLLYPMVGVVFAVHRMPWRKLVWVAGPVVTLFAGECILNWAVHGSPVERFVVAGAHRRHSDLVAVDRLDALIQVPRTLWELPGGRMLAVLSWTVPVALVLRRRRACQVVATWTLLYWLPLTLATGVVDPRVQVFPGNMMRYWMAILPAIAIGGLGVAHVGISALVARGRAGAPVTRRLAPAMVMALASVAAVLAVHDMRDVDLYRGHGATQLYELRSWLERDGSTVDVLWTDRRTARVLPIYFLAPFGRRVWGGEVRAFDGDGGLLAGDPADRAGLVLYALALPGGVAELTPTLDDIPPGWVVALARDDGTLVVYRK